MDTFGHFLLGVLKGAVGILLASAQTADADPFIGKHAVINAFAAFRGICNISHIMIPGNIEERLVDHGDQKFQIFVLQIAAGNDQFNAFYTVRTKMIPQCGTFHIRNQQNFHDRLPPGN